MNPPLKPAVASGRSREPSGSVNNSVNEVFAALLADRVIRNCAFCFWRVPGVLEVRPYDIDTFGSAWHVAYAREDFRRQDPVLSRAADMLEPLDWRVARRQMARARRYFGLVDSCALGPEGVTVPLRGPFGDMSLFTVTADPPDGEWPMVRLEILRTLSTVHANLHRRLLAAQFGISVAAQIRLTQRERQCLALAAGGLTSQKIAQELGLSVNTVNSYIDSAISRLGAANRSHGVAKAVACGIIPPPV